jgi:hypothetical protein
MIKVSVAKAQNGLYVEISELKRFPPGENFLSRWPQLLRLRTRAPNQSAPVFANPFAAPRRILRAPDPRVQRPSRQSICAIRCACTAPSGTLLRWISWKALPINLTGARSQVGGSQAATPGRGQGALAPSSLLPVRTTVEAASLGLRLKQRVKRTRALR